MCGEFKIILRFEGFRGKSVDPFSDLHSLAQMLVYWQKVKPWLDEAGQKAPPIMPKGQYTDIAYPADGGYVVTIVLEISSATPLKHSKTRAYENYLLSISQSLQWPAIEHIELTVSTRTAVRVK
jgi:hypothetical protein